MAVDTSSIYGYTPTQSAVSTIDPIVGYQTPADSGATSTAGLQAALASLNAPAPAVSTVAGTGAAAPTPAASTPVTGPNLTGGSAADSLKTLLQLLSDKSASLNPSIDSLTAGIPAAAGAYGSAIADQNKSTGLSPESLSALRTQGTSGINDQYQSAAQSLNTKLLQMGATGGGSLPSVGGDISRTYQPLYSAMEAAKTKANTDTIMADEAQKEKTLQQNQANALTAANGLIGNATSLYTASNAPLNSAASVANSLADLEGPSLAKLLGTAGLSTLTSLAPSILSKLLGLGKDATPPVDPNVINAQKGTDDAANQLGKDLASTGAGVAGAAGLSELLSGGAPPATPIPEGNVDISQTATLPDGTPLPDIANIGSGPNTAETAGLIGGGALGAGALGGLLGGGATEAAGGLIGGGLAAGAGGASAGIAGAAGTALGGGGLELGSVGGEALAAPASGGLGSTIAGLATNPITIGVAGGLVAVTALLKSQAHWEANTWTKNFQAPFDNNMKPVIDGFYNGITSGTLTKAQAQAIRDQSAQALDQYEAKIKDYSTKGSDYKTVTTQAQQTYDKYYGGLIADMDLNISRMAS